MFLNRESAPDVGSSCALMNRTGKTNAKKGLKNDYNAYKDYHDREIDAHIIASFMKFAGMKSINGKIYLVILLLIAPPLVEVQSFKEDSTEFNTKHHYPFPEDHITPVSPQELFDLLELDADKYSHKPDDVQVVNIEKIVVVPEGIPDKHEDICEPEEQNGQSSSISKDDILQPRQTHLNPDNVKVAHAIANYLKDQPNHKAYSSEACKAIYKNYRKQEKSSQDSVNFVVLLQNVHISL
ncbi:Hypothetical predicted protein [Paramuricea clavata]|uniref:Uncharacterized protein n=1 Tax=Paramuricea clavata TaxID=317549 RepID=A0A7D9I3C7_PARCT|nr:Hypothetical predicted protein [Paramuricea clavata]